MAEKIYKGIGVSEGIRIGNAYVLENIQDINTNKNILEKDINTEVERFKNSVDQAAVEIENIIARSAQTLEKDKIGVLKGQKSILSDPAYCPEIEKLITKKLFCAEKAVMQVTEKFAQIFDNMKNDYMKERATDVRDAGHRLLYILSGKKSLGLSSIKSPVILIADDLSPSDTIQLDKKLILGFATHKGGKTSHTSIFAKSMGIPAAVGLSDIIGAVAHGDTVILDGDQGIIIVGPQRETVKMYEEKMNAEIENQLLLNKYAHENAVTLDGNKIIVAANIGSSADLEYSLQQGAEAIGLLRTEQIYLSKNKFPSETELFDEYKKIAQTYSPKEVIIRTLDIGGDKALDYFNIPKEENPFLGYRAIRICLAQKPLFLTQLRAILRASAFGKLAVMFPMISGYDELMAAKSVLNEAKFQLRAESIEFDANIKTGIMIEIPSAALMADVLAKEVDFFSIGTNDLVQYTLAVDRGNESVSYLYDYCDPAIIRMIKTVTDAAHACGIKVGMCGGMAGDPLTIPLLIGLNLDELSMAAGAIAKVKYIISGLDTGECQKLAAEATQCKSAKEIRDRLRRRHVATGCAGGMSRV